MLRAIVLMGLLSGLAFGKLEGQTSQTPQMEVTVTVSAIPIIMPQVAEAAWSDILKCSQLPNSENLSPESVHWFVAPLKDMDRFHSLLGRWVPPDNIILDVDFANDSLVIAHELLHHLLRGPPVDSTSQITGDAAHPVEYFVVRCHLIPPPVGG